jgi:hypothetical protein
MVGKTIPLARCSGRLTLPQCGVPYVNSRVATPHSIFELNHPQAGTRLQTAKIGPNADLSTVGGLVAGTLGLAAIIRGTRLGVGSDQSCSNSRHGKSSSG